MTMNISLIRRTLYIILFIFLILNSDVFLCRQSFAVFYFSKTPTLLSQTLAIDLWGSPQFLDCKASSWSSSRMSQLQFQSPGSPVPSSAPLQLAQPQPGFSIPSATGSLPSENASHPLRSSALPSASATPFCNPAGRWKHVGALEFTL